MSSPWTGGCVEDRPRARRDGWLPTRCRPVLGKRGRSPGAWVIGADVGRAAMQLNRTLMLLGVSGLLGCATSGVAPGKTYTVPLTAAAEAPPCGGAGPTASGSSTIVVAADDSSISAT